MGAGGGKAVDRGLLKDNVYKLTGVRTKHFDDAFVQGLDERNRDRMGCLPPWLQEWVATCYDPGDKGAGGLRDANRYFSGMIGGARKLHDSGLTREECQRMIGVAARTRVHYTPCRDFGNGGHCPMGDRCRYSHVPGVSEL